MLRAHGQFRINHWRRRPSFGLAARLTLAGALGAGAGVLVLAPAPAQAVTPYVQIWSTTLNDAGNPIALSSPNVATLDSAGQSVIVGDRAGNVYAFHLSNGSAVAGWPASAGYDVDSTPSVSALGGASTDTVFVGAGSAAASDPEAGAYEAFNANGTRAWTTEVQNPSTDKQPFESVQASMAVGNLQGQTDVVAGSLGEAEDELTASNGTVNSGFPWFQADSDFTTPAIANIEGANTNDIIEGGDSTAGVAYNYNYTNGGHIRILSATGNAGQAQPNDGLVCQYNTNQVVQSSPAVGNFLPGNTLGIVAGTGTFYSGASNTDQLLAINNKCALQWSATLNGATNSSPALADILGNGSMQIAQGTNQGSNAGSVYVLNGNGSVAWSAAATGEVIGSVVTADLNNTGYQDVIAATTDGVDVFDGKTGAELAVLAANEGFQNSPLVTDDANGTIGITVAGYNSANAGVITHFEWTGSNGSLATESGAWPMFHHDPQLTGSAGTPAVTPPPPIEVPCTAPAAPASGYWLVGADGGIFSYNLPYCGSTGSIVLNKPIVGMIGTPDAGGYWFVASDGGVFAFGDAGYYGSMGGKPLNKPIVGMATTPDGKGYWLVASDGGIFTFGDAAYDGSEGGKPLNKPIVGIASTPDGKGYYEVASDGGIFTFGDATYQGSTGAIHLNKPVVGMAVDTATGGYWMVASDGGIFAFNAPADGSTGATTIPAPVVGMAPVTGGAGYRFVGSDGSVYNEDAHSYGDLAGTTLTKPIVGMAGY